MQLDLQIWISDLNEWPTARNTQLAGFAVDAPVQRTCALEGFATAETVGQRDAVGECSRKEDSVVGSLLVFCVQDLLLIIVVQKLDDWAAVCEYTFRGLEAVSKYCNFLAYEASNGGGV